MPTIISPRLLLAIVVLLAGLMGCAAPAPAPVAATKEAQAALATGEYERAVELLLPQIGADDESQLLLARARLGMAEQRRDAAPHEPANLRSALNQIALALPLAGSAPELHQGLLAVQTDLLNKLSQPQRSEAQPAVEADVAAVTPAPAPPPPPAPRPPAPRPRPAAAAPAAVSYVIAERKSFEGSGNSGSFAACIDIQVLGANGPVAGAVLGINNGEHSYQNQTDANGYTGRCGLGASHWSVVLFYTPGEGTIQGSTTTVYLNGAADQRGAVVFRRR